MELSGAFPRLYREVSAQLTKEVLKLLLKSMDTIANAVEVAEDNKKIKAGYMTFRTILTII